MPAREDPLSLAAQEVLETCQAELETEPEPAVAGRLHFEIARMHELCGDPTSAREAYEEALRLAPEMLGALRCACRLALARGDYDAALELFDREIDLVSDRTRKAALHVAKGRVLEDRVGRPEEARACYAAAVALEPTSGPATAAMAHAAVRAEDWEAVQRSHEFAANAAGEDKALRAAHLVRRAAILESRMGRPEDATELYVSGLEVDTRAGAALDALKRLLHGQHRWHDLVRALEIERSLAGSSNAEAATCFAIGRLHSERLGDRAAAIASLAEANRLYGGDVLVLEELARLSEAAGDTAMLAQVLESLAKTLARAPERLGLLHRLGMLNETALRDEDAAIRWHEMAVSLDATYSPSLRALTKLYTRRGAWGSIVQMNLTEAEVAKDPRRRAAALARAADLLESRFGRPDQAAEHHAAALALDPGAEGSFKALARLYADLGRHEPLLQLYETAVDRATDRDVAITYLLKIGALYEDALHDPARALHAYSRVLEREPAHLGALHSMQRSAEVAGKHEELVKALELEAEQSEDRGRRLALLHRAGDVLVDHLDRAEAALRRYRDALELDSESRPVLASLGRLLHREGRWNDLLDVFERELLVASEASQRVSLLHKMGELCERQIGDDDRAMGFYRRAVEEDPGHEPSMHALGWRLRARGEYSELAELFELELEGLEEPAARAQAAYRLGEVYEVHLDQLERAVNAYGLAVAAVPDYGPARDGLVRVLAQREAWETLSEDFLANAERGGEPSGTAESFMRAGSVLMDRVGQQASAMAAFERARQHVPSSAVALLALEHLYLLAAPDKLAGLYKAQAETFDGLAARTGALAELARTHAVAGKGPEQRAALFAALALDERSPSVLFDLEALAVSAGDADLLADVSKRLAAIELEPSLASLHHVRRAEVLEQQGADTAAAAYRAALAVDSGNLAAIRGLVRIAEETNNAGAWVEATQREQAWTRRDDHAASLLVRTARVRISDLDDPEGAEADLVRALERCPGHEASAVLFEELMLGRNKVEPLVSVLTVAAQSTSEPDRRAALGVTLARLHREHRQDLPAAALALERVVREQPEHITACIALADVYEQLGRWGNAVELLERVIDSGQAPDETQLLTSSARILLEEMEEPARALSLLQRAATAAPKDLRVLALLMRALGAQGEREQAAAIARDLMAAAASPEQRCEALLAVGKLEQGSGRTEEAQRAFVEAVELSGANSDAARALQALAMSLGQWSVVENAFAGHLKRLAGDATVAQARGTETLIELARVQRERLQRSEDAIRTLREGLAGPHGDGQVADALSEHLRAAGRGRDAAAELTALASEHPTRTGAWRALARMYAHENQPAESRLALAPLVVLRSATAEEREQVAAGQARPGLARSGALAAARWSSIAGDQPGTEALLRLLPVINEHLARMYPADPKAWGLSPRDRVIDPTTSALRALLDRLLPVYGLTQCELYVHGGAGLDAVAELGVPATLFVPHGVERLSEAQQVFVLGRMLGVVARGLQAATRLGVDELELLLVAATDGSRAPMRSVDPNAVADRKRRISKALPRKARRSWEDAVAALARTPSFELTPFLASVVTAATRSAAVLSGDLAGCLDVIRAGQPDPNAAWGANLLTSSGVAADLVRYWVSPAAMSLRQLLGTI